DWPYDARHMTAATAFFLLVRAAHVLLATIWVGSVALTTFFLMPALEEAGPSAGPVMGALMRRKLPVFMSSIGGTTVLTGLYLYYPVTGGFRPPLSASTPGQGFRARGGARHPGPPLRRPRGHPDPQRH